MSSCEIVPNLTALHTLSNETSTPEWVLLAQPAPQWTDTQLRHLVNAAHHYVLVRILTGTGIPEQQPLLARRQDLLQLPQELTGFEIDEALAALRPQSRPDTIRRWFTREQLPEVLPAQAGTPRWLKQRLRRVAGGLKRRAKRKKLRKDLL